MEEELLSSGSKKGFFYQFCARISQWYQGVVDRTVPWRKVRWLSAILLVVGFLVRVLLAQFLAEDNGPELPTRANEEFRPFIRRLPEFKFWYSVTKSTVIGIICTFFECFNIPVFWPILVMYFITLFCITMKRQIRHMIKYRYLPFTHGKPKYQGHEETTGKVITTPK
nr:protein RER1 [Leptinotarsa decemlineata]